MSLPDFARRERPLRTAVLPGEEFAVTFDTCKVRRLTRHIAAEIEGIDLRKPLDDTTWEEHRRALHENLAVFFRDQRLHREEHTALALRFGRPEVHEVFTPRTRIRRSNTRWSFTTR